MLSVRPESVLGSVPAPTLTHPESRLQLESIGVANEESARRNLRELLFNTPDANKHISGVVRGVVGTFQARVCPPVPRFREAYGPGGGAEWVQCLLCPMEDALV